ncbi:MAG: hypothetical protein V3T70_04400 [Phycisphaerae bacterium]
MCEANDPDVRIAALRDKLDARKQLQERLNTARQDAMQAEYRGQALELCLEQMQAEIQSLESLSLNSIVCSIMGSRTRRREALRAEADDMDAQIQNCEQSLASLRDEIAGVEKEVGQLDACEAEYNRLCSDKQQQLEQTDSAGADQLRNLDEELQAARQALPEIESAMSSADEALRDLDSELGAVGGMGHCNIAEGARPLKALMNASRRRSADDCAARIRSSVGRFERKLTDVISKFGADEDGALVPISAAVQRIASDLSGAWMHRDTVGESSAAHVAEQLRSASMLLEKKGNEVKADIAKLEERRQRLI